MNYIMHKKKKYLAKPHLGRHMHPTGVCYGCFFDAKQDSDDRELCPEDKDGTFKCIRPRAETGSKGSKNDVIFIENTPEAIAEYVARRMENT